MNLLSRYYEHNMYHVSQQNNYTKCFFKKKIFAGTEYNLNKDKEKNWCQALQYCKRNSADLASFGDKQDNQTMIDEGQNKTFWIKFRYDDWEWEDQSCSTFRNWRTSPNRSQNCVYQDQNNPHKLMPYHRREIKRDKLCSTGKR